MNDKNNLEDKTDSDRERELIPQRLKEEFPGKLQPYIMAVGYSIVSQMEGGENNDRCLVVYLSKPLPPSLKQEFDDFVKDGYYSFNVYRKLMGKVSLSKI